MGKYIYGNIYLVYKIYIHVDVVQLLKTLESWKTLLYGEFTTCLQRLHQISPRQCTIMSFYNFNDNLFKDLWHNYLDEVERNQLNSNSA